MQAMKEALHVATSPTNIMCREEVQRKVRKACIEEKKSGSFYICGCPGTGKTMSIDRVKELLAAWSKEEVLEAELRDAKREVDTVRFDHMDLALSKAFKSTVVDTIQSLP